MKDVEMKGRVITVRGELAESIREAAEKDGITLGEELIKVIEDYLQHSKNQPPSK